MTDLFLNIIVNNMDTELQKQIDERIKKLVPEILKGSAFTDRKLTDTPTDKNQVVPRGYVTMNGITANRPTASVIGQSYFDTSIKTNGAPVWWNGTGFVDATGTYV